MYNIIYKIIWNINKMKKNMVDKAVSGRQIQKDKKNNIKYKLKNLNEIEKKKMVNKDVSGRQLKYNFKYIYRITYNI